MWKCSVSSVKTYVDQGQSFLAHNLYKYDDLNLKVEPLPTFILWILSYIVVKWEFNKNKKQISNRFNEKAEVVNVNTDR